MASDEPGLLEPSHFCVHYELLSYSDVMSDEPGLLEPYRFCALRVTLLQ